MTRPRVGFLGLGWIGLHRMQALHASGHVDIVALADPSREMRERAAQSAPKAALAESLEELLSCELDGVVIATPSALHAAQSTAALRAGCAVFCQKPLARTAADTRAVVACARAEDRLLQVDFSYRYTAALQAVHAVVRSGELGPIYRARLVFHNAYGPDKPWYYQRAESGGGCVMDLGVHLVDSALWLLPDVEIERVQSNLFAQGEPVRGADAVEDFASVRMEARSGAVIDLECSWKVHAGQDAVIDLELIGPHGAVRMHNVAGSFYDLRAERMQGTSRHALVEPPDDWGGRAIVRWGEQLVKSARFDAAAEQLHGVADVLDRIYGREQDA